MGVAERLDCLGLMRLIVVHQENGGWAVAVDELGGGGFDLVELGIAEEWV